MQDTVHPHPDLANSPAGARIVLFGLLAPIIALSVVLWFFLPGGLASRTYTPSAYAQQVHLAPLAWRNRAVTVRGYAVWSCDTPVQVCPGGLWLTDRPLPRPLRFSDIPRESVQVLPQAEAGWHAALRRVLPGLENPFPAGVTWDQRVDLTGSLAAIAGPSRTVMLRPRTL